MLHRTLSNNSLLVHNLRQLDVDFFLSDDQKNNEENLSPESLIFFLSTSKESRFRLALIPLFLTHPNFSEEISGLMINLPKSAKVTLIFYYCAAVFLQQKYKHKLISLGKFESDLPILFEDQLNFKVSNNPDENLSKLSQNQQLITGRLINWYGTYEHAIKRLVKHLEWQKNERSNQ